MKLKHLKLLIIFLVISGVSWLWIYKHIQSQNLKKLYVKDRSYFVPVPITKFNEIQAPCLTVEVAGNPVSAMLDLGFRGILSTSKEILRKIDAKKYLSSTVKYGVRGKPYSVDVYQIPEIKIGKMGFDNPYIEEENEEMLRESRFTQDGNEPSPPEPALLGWKIFGKVNLFMDCKNSMIAFCDSFDTLVKQGYSADQFVRVPLLLERGLVECEVTISNGPLRCALDTGCTWNILNIPNKENYTFENLIWDPKNQSHFSNFTIGNKDFGDITFRGCPILLPIHVDAFLGMEFLAHHLVFIDFTNKYIYFAVK